MLKYTYDTGRIERDFVLKKVERSCKRDPEHTRLIGVMCHTCPFYEGEKAFHVRLDKYRLGDFLGHFVFCKYYKEDDEDAREAVQNMIADFEEEAITHYYD